MVSLEQVKLLESKVARAVDYVKKVTEENRAIKDKLDSYQTRIGELEVLVRQFKEEQSRIEDGILSALDRLNQFEDAVERALSANENAPPAKESALSAESVVSETPGSSQKNAPAKKENEAQAASEPAAGEELDIF
ncbi:MAG: cell division protein ZapB [Treponema sp.]|nr:cell division protein ZapB [Treponema sp.]